MKLEFKDGSYFEMIQNSDIVTIILCGKKGKNLLTMSSADLTKEQVKQIINFLQNLV